VRSGWGAGLAGLLLVVLEVVAAGAAGGPTGGPTGEPTRGSHPTGPVSAVRVLGAWDAARAAAWTARDPRALRALYLPGSTAAEADAALLRRYAARDVRLGWFGTQRFSVRVLHRSAGRLRLAVVDRVVGAASTRVRCLPLPVERPVRRVVELRRVDARWLVAAVSGPGRR
jgi:hypothetical protein